MYQLRVKQYRKSRGLSQQGLADRIGIHVSTLSKIENEKVYLSEPIERRIIAALDLSNEEIRHMLGYPKPRPKLRLVR